VHSHYARVLEICRRRTRGTLRHPNEQPKLLLAFFDSLRDEKPGIRKNSLRMARGRCHCSLKHFNCNML